MPSFLFFPFFQFSLALLTLFQILGLVEEQKYQIACMRYFEVTHNVRTRHILIIMEMSGRCICFETLSLSLPLPLYHLAL